MKGAKLINTEDIYSIQGLLQKEKELFLQWIGDALVNLAAFWEIPSLPDDCKIKIVFLEQAKFKRELILSGLEKHISDFAITTDKVLVKKYTDVENILSPKEYQQIVVHECVHILQMYTTAIMPRNHVWLYESIACYMAGQDHVNVNRKEAIPKWNLFCSSFYSCSNAYYWAYKVGAYIFNHYNRKQILEICRDCELASKVGKDSWISISNEILSATVDCDEVLWNNHCIFEE